MAPDDVLKPRDRAEELAAERGVLQQFMRDRLRKASQPRHITKRTGLVELTEDMEVFVPGAETPEEAVERFLDGGMTPDEYEVVTSPTKNIAMLVPWKHLDRRKVYIQVVYGRPFQIKGWIFGRDVNPRHVKNGYAQIFAKDPVFRHPKGLLDTFWRGFKDADGRIR